MTGSLNNYLIFTMTKNNTGRRRKVRQCVLPVERGGVDGCVGDAEAEEVGLLWGDHLDIAPLCWPAPKNLALPRSVTAMNAQNGTLGQSGLNAGENLSFWESTKYLNRIQLKITFVTFICSKTCGGGERSRGRDCVLPSYQVPLFLLPTKTRCP